MTVWIVRDSNGWTYVSATRREAINYIGTDLQVITFENEWQEIPEGCCTLERASHFYNGA